MLTILYRGYNRLRRAVLRVFAFLTADRCTLGPLLGGARIRRDGSAMSLALAADCCTYDDAIALLSKLIKPNDNVVDVGANIGVYSCTMARLNGPLGRVWAIEPTPHTFDRLHANVLLNNTGRILCINAAAGDQWGSVNIRRHNDDDSQNSITNSAAPSATRVVQAPLDELICLPEEIDLLKIDVEGAELLVLQGASQALQRTRHILIEVFEPNLNRFGASAEQLLMVLRRAGFHLFLWEGRELVGLRHDRDFAVCTDVLGIRC